MRSGLASNISVTAALAGVVLGAESVPYDDEQLETIFTCPHHSEVAIVGHTTMDGYNVANRCPACGAHICVVLGCAYDEGDSQ
jgi:hypothetical protein